MKKDFSKANTARVYDAIAQATAEPAQEAQAVQEEKKPRKTYNAQEAQEMREAGTTQGRGGCKATRINMAFLPPVYEYLKTMSRVQGKTITDFANEVLAKSLEDNAELYAQAKEFLKSFK